MSQPDTTIKSFRVELKTDLPYYLIILPIMFLLGIITKPSAISTWPLMIILIVATVCYSFLMYRLTLIEIDTVKGEAILTKTNLLKNTRAKSYPLGDLQFTYKRGKPGLYHRLVNICRLYLKDKEIAAIIPDHDGWTDDTVNDLAKGLVNMGVPKKFIGYSGREAKINGL